VTLRDLRWRLAYAVWAPAGVVEGWIHDWEVQQIRGRRLDMGQRLHIIFGPKPLRLRILYVLVVKPCLWLSDAIYQDWVADERASLSYWKRAS